MSNVFVEGGWTRILDAATAAGKIARIRLFQNNHTPAYTDVFSGYTDATFSGYAGFASLSWGAAFINGSNEGEIDATPVAWTHNGGGTSNVIYGVFVTDGSNNLIYAERFPAPISMGSSGDTITYTPQATMINQ